MNTGDADYADFLRFTQILFNHKEHKVLYEEHKVEEGRRLKNNYFFVFFVPSLCSLWLYFSICENPDHPRNLRLPCSCVPIIYLDRIYLFSMTNFTLNNSR